MAVNVRGVFLGCKYAIPAMEAAGGGSIINIASFVALIGCSVPQDAYTASKGAVLSLTRSLAVQFGPNGIRTNAICPGPVETPLLMDWLVKDEEAKRIRLARNPTGRFGKPEEIVNMAVYLASDESRWTNGASLVVDGGITDQLLLRDPDDRRGARGRIDRGASTERASTDAGTAAGSHGPLAVGVDVGGSGIKAAVVDITTGELVSERLRVPTPTPSTPDRVSASIGRLVRRLAKANELERETPVGIGLPGVAIGGVLMTAANIDPAWIGYPIAERLSYLLKRRVEIVNDADAAGIAELRFGVGGGPARHRHLPHPGDRRRVGRVR